MKFVQVYFAWPLGAYFGLVYLIYASKKSVKRKCDLLFFIHYLAIKIKNVPSRSRVPKNAHYVSTN